MNYGLALSLKLEKHLLALEAAGEVGEETRGGQCLEDRAMDMAIEEIYQENGQKWKPWASNGKALRVGDVILIVDSDTIVPEVNINLVLMSSVSYTDRDCGLLGLLQRCCP